MKFIGVDLGGTNIVVGLMKNNGTIIKSYTRDTISSRSIEEIFDDIIDMCKVLIKEFKLDISTLKGIGLGVPGVVDSKTGNIIYSNNIKIENFNAINYMIKNLSTDFSYYVGNDADCAALGELVNGAGKGFSDIVILTLGTGIGGGIIINHKIFSGFYPGGAELGHQTIIHKGVKCSCGNNGCLEAYASATALIRDAKEIAKNNKDSLLNELCKNDLSNMTAKMVFDARDMGDKCAITLADNYIEYLSVGVANFINIFNPQALLLGGGVSKQGDKLIKPLIEKTLPKIFASNLLTKIDVMTLGNEAGLIGAGMLGR